MVGLWILLQRILCSILIHIDFISYFGRLRIQIAGVVGAYRVAVQPPFKHLVEVMQMKTQRPPTRTSNSDTRRVYLLHWHHEAAREKVARYLERLDLELIFSTKNQVRDLQLSRSSPTILMLLKLSLC
jgi:hypothetical protein